MRRAARGREIPVIPYFDITRNAAQECTCRLVYRFVGPAPQWCLWQAVSKKRPEPAVLGKCVLTLIAVTRQPDEIALLSAGFNGQKRSGHHRRIKSNQTSESGQTVDGEHLPRELDLRFSLQFSGVLPGIAISLPIGDDQVPPRRRRAIA